MYTLSVSKYPIWGYRKECMLISDIRRKDDSTRDVLTISWIKIESDSLGFKIADRRLIEGMEEIMVRS